MQQDQRFDGWKAIANFLGRERTTASRWARERGLPVHRVPGGQTGTVYALRSELEAWLAGNGPNGESSASVLGQHDHAISARTSAPTAGRFGIAPIGYVVLFIGIALAIWWSVGRSPAAAAKAPVTIATVASSSASHETREFAKALTTDLARFANASADLAVYEREPGKANTQYAVRTDIERTSEKVVAQVRLVAVKDGEVIWSRRYEQSDPALSMLRDRVAANIVSLLRCSFGGLAGERAKVRSVDLTQVMTICQDFEDNNMAAARVGARRLTIERSDLGIGWALLAVTEGNLIDELDDPTLQAQARANAERARQIAPNSPLTWMALTAATGVAASAPEALPMTDAALQRHPDHPWLLGQRSFILFNLGYVQASVAPAMNAHRNCPSFVYVRDVAVQRLMAAGRFGEAQQLQSENERLWPSHTKLMETRARIFDTGPARRQADIDLIRETEQRFTESPHAAYLLARLYERTGNRAVALQWLERAPVKDAHQQSSLLFWPDAAGLRTEPAFFRKMAELGLVRWWIERGRWPDFCREPGLKYSCALEAAKLRRS